MNPEISLSVYSNEVEIELDSILGYDLLILTITAALTVIGLVYGLRKRKMESNKFF